MASGLANFFAEEGASSPGSGAVRFAAFAGRLCRAWTTPDAVKSGVVEFAAEGLERCASDHLRAVP